MQRETADELKQDKTEGRFYFAQFWFCRGWKSFLLWTEENWIDKETDIIKAYNDTKTIINEIINETEYQNIKACEYCSVLRSINQVYEIYCISAGALVQRFFGRPM